MRVAALLVALTSLAPLPLRGTPATPPIDDLLARAATYVERLKTELAVVIADEHYDQRYGSVKRSIQSEMLFMWVADERFWLTVRNVLRVDGEAVPDSRARIDRILKDPSPETVARLRRVQAEGSRFNLGNVVRTTNTPTLVLQFLTSENQPRFAFELKDAEQVAGDTAWKIAFSERQRPTVIAFNGNPAPSSGAVWIRARDGAVVRTEERLLLSELQVHVRVEFRHDPRLDAWVPAKMDEKYEPDHGLPIACTAKYGNYRRFETAGRLVPPPSTGD